MPLATGVVVRSMATRKSKVQAASLRSTARFIVGIVQLMAASENTRPLIYAAYGDRRFASEFFHVYVYLIRQGARVGHLYRYLREYCHSKPHASLFDFILRTPVVSLRR